MLWVAFWREPRGKELCEISYQQPVKNQLPSKELQASEEPNPANNHLSKLGSVVPTVQCSGETGAPADTSSAALRDIEEPQNHTQIPALRNSKMVKVVLSHILG